MNRRISTPIQLALLTATVSAIVVALRPEPAELPDSVLARAAAPSPTQRATGPNPAYHEDLPWKRPILTEPNPAKEPPAQTTDVPPLPAHANATSNAGHPPPLPPPVEAKQDQPDIVYLGRMITGDKIQVFLSSRGQTSVVSEGGVVDGVWVVQSVTTENVTLKNTDSGVARVIAMGDSANSSPTHVNTVQIGPRFVTSAPPQNEAPN